MGPMPNIIAASKSAGGGSLLLRDPDLHRHFTLFALYRDDHTALLLSCDHTTPGDGSDALLSGRVAYLSAGTGHCLQL